MCIRDRAIIRCYLKDVIGLRKYISLILTYLQRNLYCCLLYTSNRSVNAIKLKAGRLNLGPMLENGSYVTLNQVAIALTGRPFSSYYKKSWIENRGMPVPVSYTHLDVYKRQL